MASVLARVVPLMDNVVSAFVILLAVPLAVLAVGTPIALSIRLLLWAFDLL